MVEIIACIYILTNIIFSIYVVEKGKGVIVKESADDDLGGIVIISILGIFSGGTFQMSILNDIKKGTK